MKRIFSTTALLSALFAGATAAQAQTQSSQPPRPVGSVNQPTDSSIRTPGVPQPLPAAPVQTLDGPTQPAQTFNSPNAPVYSVDTEPGPTPASGIDSSRLNPPQPQAQTTAQPLTQTGVNLSSANIIDAQQRLTESGFKVGTPDGMLGAQTQQAVQAYQRQQGLPPSGQLDALTLQRLGIIQNQTLPGMPANNNGAAR